MGFREYIKEMPIFLEKIMCHDGHLVEVFDMALEDSNVINKVLKTELSKNYYQKVGEVPVYCKKGNHFFIYNFDNGKSRAPNKKNKKDKMIIGALVNGMYRHAHGRQNDPEFGDSLKEIKYGWKMPEEVWSLRNLSK